MMLLHSIKIINYDAFAPSDQYQKSYF